MLFGGIKEIDAHQLAEWLKEDRGNIRVIDVREMHEIARGTVPQAKAMPLGTLPARTHEFHPEETLVMVCRSGARSAQACMFLAQKGFAKVFNLRGGMMGWVGSGLAPVALEAV
jgi:rhodanese-related sulfurtransferase